ncbi:MAG: winged helix-turn-helix domain-containing protein [Planctomycetaceae bacterium]
MPQVANMTDVEEIGTAAGKVWSFLADNGPASLTKLTKNLDVSRELAMQAIGWLAREDKIEFEQAARGRLVRLK